MKIVTTAALMFVSSFFLASQSQAEEHYVYKDPQSRLVISNKQPPEGSKILRKLDLPEFRDAQMQQVPTAGTRSSGQMEASTKPDQKNK